MQQVCLKSVDSAGFYYLNLRYTVNFLGQFGEASRTRKNRINAIMQILLQFSLGDTCIEHPPVSE